MIRTAIAAPWLALCLGLSPLAMAQPGGAAEPGARLPAFASDAELPELARTVLTEKIGDRTAIKKMVRNWQADDLRA